MMQYRKGEIVGYVDRQQGRASVPLPQRWYMLRVHPNRESKVMKAFRRLDICAYLPLEIKTIDRRTGSPARKAHLGRRVVVPLVPGLVFIPDFECDDGAITGVDGVEGWLQLGSRFASLSLKDYFDLRAVEAFLAIPRGQRKFKIGDQVRFTGGVFADFLGRVDRLDSRGRLRVFLDAIERGVGVITTETQVELVGAATQDRIADH